MSDVGSNAAPAAGAASVAPVTTTTNDGSPISVREASRLIGAARRAEAEKPPETPDKPTPQRAPDGKFAARDNTVSAPADDDAAAAVQPPGETTPDVTDAAPPEAPPVDPPRSWTNEDKEAFKALPPDIQQRIADRERARDVEIRKGQDEAAKARKAVDAERQQAEQAKLQAEQAAFNALRILQAEQQRDFADIKSVQDLTKLATEDPFRFNQWQARQESIRILSGEVEQAHRVRQEQESTQFKSWADEQDKSFAETFKEFGDPDKGPKAREGVVNYLTEVVGVPRDHLPGLWSNPVFRDARMQRVIYDGVRFHAAQEKAKAASAKPLPPVQRPGVSAPKGAGLDSEIASLNQQLDKASGLAAIRIASRLTALRRRTASS